jgi:hypothetical protein
MPNVALLRALNDTVDRLWLSVNPRTYGEESGEVHWISAHRLSSPAGFDTEPGWEDSVLDREPSVSPGGITSFNELCQKAGLHLYAKAVGLAPLAGGMKPVARLQASGQEMTLRAAEEILWEGPQNEPFQETDGVMERIETDSDPSIEEGGQEELHLAPEPSIPPIAEQVTHPEATLNPPVKQEKAVVSKMSGESRLSKALGELFGKMIERQAKKP